MDLEHSQMFDEQAFTESLPDDQLLDVLMFLLSDSDVFEAALHYYNTPHQPTSEYINASALLCDTIGGVLYPNLDDELWVIALDEINEVANNLMVFLAILVEHKGEMN